MLKSIFIRCLGESPSKQLFVEKALIGIGWKHIEVQIIGDGTGEVVHLWERECSVQRRYDLSMYYLYISSSLNTFTDSKK